MANVTLALEGFVTALVALSNEEPELLIAEPQVKALLDQHKQEATGLQPGQDPAENAPQRNAPAITIEQIRKVLAEKSQNGKQPQVKELISSFGVRRLTEVDPEKYPEILLRAEDL